MITIRVINDVEYFYIGSSPLGSTDPVKMTEVFSSALKKDRTTNDGIVAKNFHESKKLILTKSSITEGNCKLKYYVFDANLTKLSEGDFEFAADNNLVDVSDIQVNKNNDVLVVARFYPSNPAWLNSKSLISSTVNGPDFRKSNRYKIFFASFKDHKMKEYTVTAGTGKYLQTTSARLNETGVIEVSGLYSTSISEEMPKGIYFSRLNAADGTTQSFSVMDFKSSFATQIQERAAEAGKDVKDSKGEGLGYLDITDFSSLADGSLLVSGEFVKTYSVQAPGDSRLSGSASMSTFSDHLDIVTFKVDGSGNIIWLITIPRVQHAYSDHEYKSYAFLNFGDKFSFVFFDNEKNYDPERLKTGLKVANPIGKAIVTIATLDNEGKFKCAKDLALDEGKMNTVLGEGYISPGPNPQLFLSALGMMKSGVFRFAKK